MVCLLTDRLPWQCVPQLIGRQPLLILPVIKFTRTPVWKRLRSVLQIKAHSNNCSCQVRNLFQPFENVARWSPASPTGKLIVTMIFLGMRWSTYHGKPCRIELIDVISPTNSISIVSLWQISGEAICTIQYR